MEYFPAGCIGAVSSGGPGGSLKLKGGAEGKQPYQLVSNRLCLHESSSLRPTYQLILGHGSRFSQHNNCHERRLAGILHPHKDRRVGVLPTWYGWRVNSIFSIRSPQDGSGGPLRISSYKVQSLMRIKRWAKERLCFGVVTSSDLRTDLPEKGLETNCGVLKWRITANGCFFLDGPQPNVKVKHPLCIQLKTHSDLFSHSLCLS